MAAHNNLGKAGEDAATAYLEDKGYVIRHRNWHRGHLELDIVAAQDGELVVVEVKTRTDDHFGQPEEAVNATKIRRLVQAANTYIRLYSLDCPVRFDVITAIGHEGSFHIRHIENAFYPPLC